jgi:hypothetical protein
VVPHASGFVRLPALSGVAVRNLDPVHGQVTVGDMVLDNGRIRAVFNKGGEVESLCFDDHEVPLKGPAGQLHLYPDQPQLFEAWEKLRQSYSLGRQINGSAKATYGLDFIRFDRKLSEKSSAVVTYGLLPGCGHLQIAFEVDGLAGPANDGEVHHPNLLCGQTGTLRCRFYQRAVIPVQDE